MLPELTHVRFIISSGDVIHSYACPALGVKCDAYPGRLNQVSVLVNREGSLFGKYPEKKVGIKKKTDASKWIKKKKILTLETWLY